MADLSKTVKIALDELRMQMLGTQVLFGFQLQGVFQDAFDTTSEIAKWTDAAALLLIVVTLALLIAGPSQHRMVEEGNATARILNVAQGFANLALLPFALAIGCDLFVVLDRYLGRGTAIAIAVIGTAIALFLLYGLGERIRSRLPPNQRNKAMPPATTTTIDHKVEQMLTESRVILPGAQALFGFQLVVILSRTFEKLPAFDRDLHFSALIANTLAIMLLLTPAAVHRIAFEGRDTQRFHAIGSRVITLALIPFAIGIACDFYVAAGFMAGNRMIAAAGAAAAASLLFGLWFALPLGLRAMRH